MLTSFNQFLAPTNQPKCKQSELAGWLAKFSSAISANTRSSPQKRLVKSLAAESGIGVLVPFLFPLIGLNFSLLVRHCFFVCLHHSTLQQLPRVLMQEMKRGRKTAEKEEEIVTLSSSHSCSLKQ